MNANQENLESKQIQSLLARRCPDFGFMKKKNPNKFDRNLSLNTKLEVSSNYLMFSRRFYFNA